MSGEMTERGRPGGVPVDAIVMWTEQMEYVDSCKWSERTEWIDTGRT
jgi:hypothetical protein